MQVSKIIIQGHEFSPPPPRHEVNKQIMHTSNFAHYSLVWIDSPPPDSLFIQRRPPPPPTHPLLPCRGWMDGGGPVVVVVAAAVVNIFTGCPCKLQLVMIMFWLQYTSSIAGFWTGGAPLVWTAWEEQTVNKRQNYIHISIRCWWCAIEFL